MDKIVDKLEFGKETLVECNVDKLVELGWGKMDGDNGKMVGFKGWFLSQCLKQLPSSNMGKMALLRRF